MAKNRMVIITMVFETNERKGLTFVKLADETVAELGSNSPPAAKRNKFTILFLSE